MAQDPRESFLPDLEVMLGSDKVYFQPPTDITMVYPCLLVIRDDEATKRANNGVYSRFVGYQVTHISRDQFSEVIDKLAEYPLSSFERYFATSGLHHDVFVIYH